MTALLTNAERSMRWNAERQTDRPEVSRARDPKLTHCRKCGSKDVVFMRFEAAGKVSGNRITPNILHYVRCKACRYQTLPRKSKKLAADIWSVDTEGFIPQERNAPE
jgi:ribosomal protein L40E